MEDKLESGRTLEALRRKNLEGKRLFIEELRRQKTTKSVSLLLEILCDESWFLRELAIGALVESGELAISPLRDVLRSGLWYTRAAAARALGRAGDGLSAPHILALLDESNRTVREAAVDAIQALAACAGTDSLCTSLADSPRERRVNRLSQIGHVAPDLSSRLETGTEAILSARSGAAIAAVTAQPQASVPQTSLATVTSIASGPVPGPDLSGSTPAPIGFPRMSESIDGGRGGPAGAH